MSTKLEFLSIEGDEFFYSMSFDIDDFIGDGVWWLQLYDCKQNLIYDKTFASTVGKIGKKNIMKIIKNDFLTVLEPLGEI